MSAEAGQRLRDRAGHMMRWVRAHDSLPDLSQRAAVLCFHAVAAHRLDPDVECEVLHVSDFRRLLRVLQRSFRVISLGELVTAVREHRSPPPRSVVITFDDGYANNATVAAEELDRLHMPWSAFLPAQLIETGGYQWIDDVRLMVHAGGRRKLVLPAQEGATKYDLATAQRRHEAVEHLHQVCRYVPDAVRQERLAVLYTQFTADELADLRARYAVFAPMTWTQARQLKSAGVDVGSHSLTHTALGPQSPEALRHEIHAARSLIQHHLGEDSPHFSYPYGRLASISADTEAALVEAGYHCALTLEQDAVRCREVNLMQTPRLIVSPHIGRMVFSLWQRFVR